MDYLINSLSVVDALIEHHDFGNHDTNDITMSISFYHNESYESDMLMVLIIICFLKM